MLDEHLFTDKRILITGGTGSLGGAFMRRIMSEAHGTPAKIVVLSRDEAKQHAMAARLISDPDTPFSNRADLRKQVEFRIGDVRNYSDVVAAMRNVQIVIHAAALKQVPQCEYFPEQAVLTNCLGPSNIARAVLENPQNPIETVVGISTDKACKPVSAMGASKLLHERILIAANLDCPDTRFICSRYGNVLASRGSVVPLFQDQIKRGGPVTVTVPEMTRFLMSLDEAVDCVFAAIAHAEPGETFVPRVASTTIMNLAEALVGNRPIEIQVQGVRPGEKMHEIMISDEEALNTVCRGNYYAIRSMLPELATNTQEGASKLTGEYSSEHSVISLEETVDLLDRNGLLLDRARKLPRVAA